MNIITDKIADRFTYDPLTGDLTWKEFVKGKRIPLGTYTSWFEAVCSRKSAEVKYGIIL